MFTERLGLTRLSRPAPAAPLVVRPAQCNYVLCLLSLWSLQVPCDANVWPGARSSCSNYSIRSSHIPSSRNAFYFAQIMSDQPPASPLPRPLPGKYLHIRPRLIARCGRLTDWDCSQSSRSIICPTPANCCESQASNNQNVFSPQWRPLVPPSAKQQSK